MKKFLLLFASLLLLGLSVQAQNKRRPQESNRVYMELGPSLSWIYGNQAATSLDPLAGFNFGLGYTKPLFGALYTHTGLYVTRKGFRFTGQLFDNLGQPIGLADETGLFDYLIVPYLLRYEAGDRVRLYIEAGPYAGFLYRAESKMFNEPPMDITSSFKRYDVGASAGVGFGFSLGENFFGTVGARYSIGFIDIRENTSRGVGPVKTSVVDGRFGFGYWLANR